MEKKILNIEYTKKKFQFILEIKQEKYISYSEIDLKISLKECLLRKTYLNIKIHQLKVRKTSCFDSPKK